MNPLKKLAYIISWLPLFVINFAFVLVGIPLIAVLARWPMSKWPRWTWIWQNDGDAIDVALGAAGGDHDVPRWYLKKYGPEGEGWGAYRLRFAYMAIRNPVNNHRFLLEDVTEWSSSGDADAFSAEGSTLLAEGKQSSAGWRYSGFFAGYKRTWLNKTPGKYSEIYFGWKVGSRTPGFGFTLQLRFNRPFIGA